MMRVLSVALAALALGLAAADSPARVGGTRTLAILDDAGMRGTHSVYFNSLKGSRFRMRYRLDVLFLTVFVASRGWP